MRRELPEAMSAGAENCRRADSINYIYNQPVFEYEGKCGEMGTACRIRELARTFSNEIRQFRARHVPEFEIMVGCRARGPRRIPEISKQALAGIESNVSRADSTLQARATHPP
jgi:hypothetical protein